MRVHRPFETGRRVLFSKPALGFIVVSIALLMSFFFIFDGNLDTLMSLRLLQSQTRGDLRTRHVAQTVNSCLDADGPQPFILMSIGRTGSGSTFQVLSNLTGMETPSEEYTGSNPIQSTRFFRHVQNDGGWWVTENLCKKQRLYPDAGIVGFKWKPWKSIYSQPAIDGLNFIAQSQNPTIKVVRLRRNLLDVYLSGLKHKHRVPGHCRSGDEECFEKHRLAGTNMTVPANEALEFLEEMTRDEDDVDALLDRLNVPHVHVTYGKLYHSDTADEWMKIFEFLGVGPAEGLTRQQVNDAMGMESTSNAHHKDSVLNYDELRGALEGTKFENLLHL